MARTLQDRDHQRDPNSQTSSADTKLFPKDVVVQVSSTIDSCKAVLDQISGFLSRLEDGGVLGKLRWGLGWHDEVTKLLGDLTRHYHCLDLALDAIIM